MVNIALRRAFISTSRADQGTRSWLFRYRAVGKIVWMGIGSAADKPLTEARDEAAMLRVLVKRGGDPFADKREVEAKRAVQLNPKAPTFDECVKWYAASHEESWKNDKHVAQWKSTLANHCGPVIGKKRIDEIALRTCSRS